MIDVIAIVKEIEQLRRSQGIQPPFVLHTEIIKEVNNKVKEELNKAVTDGVLEFHRTINDVSFNLK